MCSPHPPPAAFLFSCPSGDASQGQRAMLKSGIHWGLGRYPQRIREHYCTQETFFSELWTIRLQGQKPGLAFFAGSCLLFHLHAV